MLSNNFFLSLFLLAFVLKIIFVSSDPSLSGGVRNNEVGVSPPLKCAVIVVSTEFAVGVDDPEVNFLCSEVTGNRISELAYNIELPAPFLDKYGGKLLRGDREILIHGGFIEEDKNEVFIPDENSVQLVRGSRVVPDLSGYVSRDVLVVRVTTDDSIPTYTADELSTNFFADDRLTLRSQFAACSFGKLTFEKARDSLAPGKIVEGVMDIHLNVNASTSTRLELTNMAIAETQQILESNVTDVVNHVVICHPQGSLEPWLAYAYVHQPITVFNGKWCGYISANMHEIGHNLGFTHSNQDGIYDDKTGYMGWSYEVAGWPSLCFNAEKNWRTGWFADRAVEIDVNKGVWTGKIATFVDYDITKPDEYVVAKVGDIQFQYNRAKGMNAQTYDKPNQLVIVESTPEGSELMAGIDGIMFNTTFFQKTNFGDNGETLFIAVCSRHIGDNVTQADYFDISVGLDAIDCSQNDDITISNATYDDSTSLANEYVDTDRGEMCDDNITEIFYVSGIGNTDCRLLQQSEDIRNFLCIPGMQAWDTCAETCGKCSDDCHDNNDMYFQYNEEWRTCEWVRIQDDFDLSDVCRHGGNPHRFCSETCNSCLSQIDGDNCVDSDSTFDVFPWGPRTCDWLATLPANIKIFWHDFLCQPENETYDLCPKTCGKCFELSSCEDSDEAFDYDGAYRSCDWLASEPTMNRLVACESPVIRDTCRETCGNCA